jgi:hypothetical protein
MLEVAISKILWALGYQKVEGIINPSKYVTGTGK